MKPETNIYQNLLPLMGTTQDNIRSQTDEAFDAYFDHCSGSRVSTQAVIAAALKEEYPKLEQVVVTADNCNLINFAQQTGLAQFQLLQDHSRRQLTPTSLSLIRYLAPAHRTEPGSLGVELQLAKYAYQWQSNDFIVYYIDGRDGTSAYPKQELIFVLTKDKQAALELVQAAGTWSNELHGQVWEYDQGYWSKSSELYNSFIHASWDSVILDEKRKEEIIDDHLSFFRSRETYKSLQVPWKRGIIYHGPPGNGKTISIKAMMHTLYTLSDPIPTLYVRSLVSYAGPEYSVKQIFKKARAMAPCYLILEDLDTIITEGIRSYFLNEVDGLKDNDGIMMLGSTNHLDRLDPGISQRPSRFDRKYFFDNPNEKERELYAHFWQRKLKDNKSIEFPDKLCPAIARITNDFSFAYMQEAFVASLLAIARQKPESTTEQSTSKARKEFNVEETDSDWLRLADDDDSDDDEELNKYVLWREIQNQVRILRKGIQEEE
ncbi:ATPase [Meira miltonrushii]|uniref:ATPase n=1 Tax=Meira miltonrushii TaxID=1280837 RepID=A0A316V6R6_9BASI|nr:ATPase [Meira miltonrushii]PWN32728.1 ATPase [Meira miltonrushii]